MSRYSPRSKNAALWDVVVVGSRDVGTVWLERTPEPDTFTLGILLGEPTLFGQGIGQKTIGLALEKIRTIPGLRVVRLHVRKDNPRAIRCYESCGFKIVSSGTRTGGGATFEFFRMEKLLASEPRPQSARSRSPLPLEPDIGRRDV